MTWLIQSWHVLLPKPWAATALAIVAVISGAWVGSERERRDKPAGLRTTALVSLGASVFTMVVQIPEVYAIERKPAIAG
jgi:putative Mg2+ transporter-C (MgtC) family protein